jgi:fibronectin type 3 domain-containing protein
VEVRVVDTDQTPGKRIKDQIIIDHMYIRCENGTPVTPPEVPTNLTAVALSSSEIDLNWDNVADESGYNIQRSLNGGSAWSQINTVGTDVTTYTDSGLNADTTYFYRVNSFNSGGVSAGYSNEANETTDLQDGIVLSARGYKVKGKQKADLTWDPLEVATANVDVYRDGNLLIASLTASDGSYTDNINEVGGGSYVYQICEEGSDTECSNIANVNF